MSEDPGPVIEIAALYKIFGNRANELISLVDDGIGKSELLSEHDHVLGLRDINMSIEGHSFQVIMGLSGSGKSTLIRHINRLIEPTAGSILVDQDDVLNFGRKELQEFRRHKVSMVFQRFALFPHKSIMDNVGYGLAMQGVPREERTSQSARWIERVGLEGYEDSLPGQLSGGMQQRVGLARALATDAEILLMDEPFSALDPLIRTDMRTLLLELQRELRKTIVFVTHDLEEAIELGDQIAILRDGEIVQNATAEEVVLEPADDYISEFTRNINRGRVLSVESIMEGVDEDLSEELTISGDTLLEDALALLPAASLDRAPVVDQTGRIIGSISLAGISSALANGRSPSI